MPLYLTKNRFLFFFLVLPLAHIVEFLQILLFGNIILPLNTYVLMLVWFMFLYYTNFKDFFLWFLFIYFVVYTVGFTIISDKYTINNFAVGTSKFTLALAAIYLYPKLIITFPLKSLNKIILIFSYILIITFYFSVFSGVFKIDASLIEDKAGDINYLRGYIIPHMFVFIMAPLFLFIAYNYKFIYSIPIALALLFAGTRTGYIILTISVIFLIIYKYNNIKNILYLISGSILFIIILISLNNSYPNNPFTNTIKRFNGITRINDMDEEEQAKLTSGRSKLFELNIEAVSHSHPATNLIGRGSLAAIDYIEKKTGSRIWFHDDFLQVLYAFGVFGLLMYFYLILKLYIKTKMLYVAIFIITTGILNGYMYYYNLSFIMLLVLLRMQIYEKK